jgi:hypothetical protein
VIERKDQRGVIRKKSSKEWRGARASLWIPRGLGQHPQYPGGVGRKGRG